MSLFFVGLLVLELNQGRTPPMLASDIETSTIKKNRRCKGKFSKVTFKQMELGTFKGAEFNSLPSQ